MALTKITGQVVDTTTDLVVGVTTVGGGVSATDGFFSGIVTAGGDASFSGNVSVGGTLTYEDVTNIDAVGLVTARNGVVVGSGITLSKDGDIFATGVTTSTTFVGNLTGNVTGNSDTATTATNSTNASHVLVTDNESTNENNLITFVEDATSSTGNVGLEMDGNLTYNPSTGTVSATAFSGDGSALTGIEVGMSTASAQVSGITTVVDLSKDDIRLDCTGLVTIDTKGGTEGGNHVLRIVNSGISTVTFNSYFKFPSGASPALPTASGAISLISFTVHTQGRVGVASVFLAGASVNFS